MRTDTKALKVEYRSLCRQLAKAGWISHGYVQDRGPGAGGPCYQWSRKEQKKTVSVALSKEQYFEMKQAINNWHKLQNTLRQMEQVSRAFLFLSLPNPNRRKPLSNKVMGII
jgi:hypothetical protein